jgi:hypothetical protein
MDPHWPPSVWDDEMLAAAREVDELAPAAPPISPGIRNQMGPWPEPPPPPPVRIVRE